MKMQQRIKALCMALLLLVTTLLSSFSDLAATTVQAEELVLRVHYHRADGEYDGWDVWLWEKGKEGAGYAFSDEDGDMVATMEVTPGTTDVGFIVRTQDWAKDIDEDQYIDISEMVSGTVDIYVESGVEGYTKEYGSDAQIGTKLKSAVYDDESESVTATMTGQIYGDFMGAFTIKGSEGTVGIILVADNGDNTYRISLEEPLNLNHSYTITYEGTEMTLQMPIIYSRAEFEEEYTYTGDDLGATYTKEKTSFRVWAPTAEAVTVNLYKSGMLSDALPYEQIVMTKSVNGTWVAEYAGDLNHVYYTYSATLDGKRIESCDPYARTTGVNGSRAMVLDLDETDPEGWDTDTNPNAGLSITDAVIYETHIRDFSVSDSSGMTNKGKYLAFTETGTTNSNGDSTGVDYLKELGITHLHIMPFYDFGSVDETKQDGYNWGYDPQNYNVPEGSYSTDPYNGEVRVAETKQMVKALHDNGISVVMDVVYNHVYSAENFCFNRLVPGYFSRINADGSYSNGSGCGNDTATERSMVKKYIVDSVNYWADEYHIDGFRFDLVGLMDVDLMNEIIDTVHETHPDVIFYGEGWTMDTDVTKDDVILATQNSSQRVLGLSFFNDTMRDGLKGNVFNNEELGYVSGATGLENQMTSAFLGSTFWCKNPYQSINYASCHDNLTLYDRLQTSCPNATTEELGAKNRLAASFYILSEGVPFMMGGEELLRSKVNEDGSFNSNSYNAGDAVNAIDWDSLSDENVQTNLEYYKGLIQFRRDHAALRLTTAEEVANVVTAVEDLPDNVTAFLIDGTQVEGEISKKIFIAYNPNDEPVTIDIPSGIWTVCINKTQAGVTKIERVHKSITLEPSSSMVLVKGNACLDDSPVLLIVHIVFFSGILIALICFFIRKARRF